MKILQKKKKNILDDEYTDIRRNIHSNYLYELILKDENISNYFLPFMQTWKMYFLYHELTLQKKTQV